MEFDRTEFKGHQEFIDDAKTCLKAALLVAGEEEQSIREYNLRLMPLVYGSVKRDFALAYASFRIVSERLLSKL